MELDLDGLNPQDKSDCNENAPLAARMRPRTLEDVLGQKHLLGADGILRSSIENDDLTSFIFWGPPGCGKSTVASVIANSTSSRFENYSAVTSGIPEVRKVIARAKEQTKISKKKTILFIDEIHRFNKAQQDALLPHVEDGTITLIGATTENPYFEVITPLLSRSKILKFEPLSEEDVRNLIKKALEEKDCGLQSSDIKVAEDAIEYLVQYADGDARRALGSLELAAKYAPRIEGRGKKRTVTLEIAQKAVQERVLSYDKNGDNHYDIISAFIKSVRGSDPDAAVYWLARMLASGEDPKFVARRLVILASEDVGNADPMGLVVATSAMQAVQFVGMPEAQITLSQATTYLACAPKSNASYKAINSAMADVREKRPVDVPVHLRDASYKGAKELGHGKGYLYPHDYADNFIKQEYVPKSTKSKKYYEPAGHGHEAKFKKRLENLWNESEQDT